MASRKEKSKYTTIQVTKKVKEQIIDHCNRHGLKISRYMENLFLFAVSGSVSGSVSSMR